ncbi:MAG: hypothetical protein KF753_03755 [Caldilineaceae bacterium]|nr:hypothetical protein [Caldilineaceae bacterium]
MNERQIPRWAKAALALVILFGLGSLLYNSGYSSGMVTGMLVSGGEGGAMNPYLLARTGGLHGGFGFFGGFLRLGFFLVFLAVIAKVFGFARWKMRMQQNGGEADNGSHGFHPMWEMHRKWHQAEEQAQQPIPPSAVPPEPPVEGK